MKHRVCISCGRIKPIARIRSLHSMPLCIECLHSLAQNLGYNNYFHMIRKIQSQSIEKINLAQAQDEVLCILIQNFVETSLSLKGEKKN